MANRVPAKAAREARNGAVRAAAQLGAPAVRRQPTPRMSPPAPAMAAPEPELPGPEVASSVSRAVAADAGRELPGTAPGWRAFLRSFVYAWRGLWHAVRTQRNARVHLTIAAAAIALGLWLGIAPVEWAMVFVAITGVFVAEMFNTVAEACVDLTTREFHPLARVAKDVAAGAVLANAILSVVIGLFVFGPHLWPLLLRLLGR
jgi:diacylglycerol kinase